MRKAALALGWLCLLAAPAFALQTSSVDPTYPATKDDIDAEPLRLQFQAIHDDENALFGLVGTSGGSCGTSGQICWYNGLGLAGFTMSGDCTLNPATSTIACSKVGGLNPFNASNINSGSLSPNVLPLPTVNSIGGVQAQPATAHQFLTGLSSLGTFSTLQPGFADLTGAATSAQMPIATMLAKGAVKPDGTTFTVDLDGTAHAVGGGTVPVSTIGSSGSSQSLSFAASGNTAYDITLTANCVLSLSGGTPGQLQTLTVVLRQDSTAGRVPTLPSGVKWTGGTVPTPNSLAGKIDVFVFRTLDGGSTVFGGYQ